MPYQRGPVKSFGTAVPATSPAQQQADLLLRQLESQLRRQLGGAAAGANLAAATRHWAERFGALVPALAGEAAEVADALQGLDDAAGAARTAGIGQAMRLLARVRSLTAGETPRQVVLPGADGPPPPAAASVSVSPRHVDIVSAGTHTARSLAPAPATQSQLTATAPRNTTVSRSTTTTAPSRGQAKPSIVKPKGGPPSSNGTPAPVPRPARAKAGGEPRRAVTRSGTGEITLNSPLPLNSRERRLSAPLTKLHIRTWADLLRHYPIRYVDYSNVCSISTLRQDTYVTIDAVVIRCNIVGRPRGPRRVEVTFANHSDDHATICGVWFGQAWRAKEFKPGTHLYVSGKVERFNGRLQLSHPDYEKVTDVESIHTGRLVPIYPLSGGLQAKWLRERVKQAVDEVAYAIEDPLPDLLRERWKLPPLHAAIQQVHFPDDEAELKMARHRIAFDDLFLLRLGLLKQRQEWQSLPAAPLALPPGRVAELLDTLPYRLTPGQQRALEDVLTDMAGVRPMGRLLQGDVGSGKTVIAALAALAAVENGYQAAVVAPTEILAEQHAKTLAGLFATMLPMLKPVLITGSLSASARADAWKLVASGQAKVVVGTHSLFSEHGAFSRLALVVIDEQHRFGVYQRDTLWRKGERPHLLAMTATPIPRTLALQQYGDLDLSVIDTLPVGRLPIKSRYAAPRSREAVYAFLRAQVKDGRQAYVICPLVDESDVVAAKAVTAEFRRLRDDVFSDLQVGLLHGRLRPAEKDQTMRRFRDGEIQVLVTTTVIEVGVDVPNATVMLIEGAERFGLAQLHQLRGRVGRGIHQSYCILMASEAVDDDGEERLRLVESTANGFALAEADLKARGTGTLFRSLQSGAEGLLRWLEFADPDEARHAAEELLADDPHLERPEHALLAARVAKLLPQQAASAETDVGDGETASLAYV